ncbi:NlpC/P60 family protein [Streptodolium elevatio]
MRPPSALPNPAGGIGAPPSAPVPAAAPLLDLLRVGQQVAALSKDIEEADARAEAARAAADAQRRRLGELQARESRARARLSAMSTEIGQLASLRYRSAGMSPTADLILRRGGTDRLHMGAVYARIATSQATLEATYAAQHRELEAVLGESRAATRTLTDREAAADRELAALREASARATRLLTGLDLAGYLVGQPARPARDPGPGGRGALMFAVSQIGRPYVWGATGPDAYDCSGLTSRAWQSVGATVPRTSQEQWAQLPRVPLQEVRPGDLVVYFPDATHIGMYLGDGMMVHAPRPGRHVTTAKLDSLPVLGVVRPQSPGEPTR